MLRFRIAASFFPLVFFVAAAAPPASAQVAPPGESAGDADAASRLEREAEDAFADDDLETAIGRYRQAVMLLDGDAEKVRILMLVAWLEHLRGRDEAATRALTDALVIAPEHTFRAELYSDAFRQLFLDAQPRAAKERAERALEQIHLARSSLTRGDRGAARRQLEAALELEPSQPHALYSLALLELEEGRDEQALALFERISTLSRTSGSPLGTGSAMAGRAPDTVPLEITAGALTNLGALYQRRGMDEEAEESLLRAVELEPSNGVAWTNLGVARRRLGRTEAAASAFRRAYELSPDDPAAATNLALSYLDARDYAAATTHLRTATARFPGQPRLWLDLGLALVGLGDPAGASQAFEQTLRLEPDDRDGHASRAAVQMARLAYAAGDHGQAVQQARRAVALRPGSADGHVYLGLAQKASGDLAAARSALEEAVRLAPERGDSHNNLGSVYYELGLYDLAETAFRRALEISPELGDARRNLEAVAAARSTGFRPGASSPSPTATGSTAPATAPPPTRGGPAAPTAPRLGLRFADIDYAALGIQGAMIASVDPGSPADRAGLRKGDLLLAVDGAPVQGGDDVLRRLGEAQAAATIDLMRDNRRQRLILPIR